MVNTSLNQKPSGLKEIMRSVIRTKLREMLKDIAKISQAKSSDFRGWTGLERQHRAQRSRLQNLHRKEFLDDLAGLMDSRTSLTLEKLNQMENHYNVDNTVIYQICRDVKREYNPQVPRREQADA